MVFRSLAYFLGPLLGGFFLGKGTRIPLFVAMIFALVAFFVLILARRKHDRAIDIDVKEVNLVKEIGHWIVLFKEIWPIILLSLNLGIIDAVFWTTGTVYTDKLSATSFLGSFFLSFYELPTIFMGIIVAKWHIYKGKKKLAEKLLFVSYLFLALLGFSEQIIFLLLLVFASSVLISIVYPLVDAVYSDVTARMGRERRHLIGLSSSSVSLAYIVGPTIAGLITNVVGERFTFVVIGTIGMVISFVLLLVTPKKLLLPQSEIRSWE